MLLLLLLVAVPPDRILRIWLPHPVGVVAGGAAIATGLLLVIAGSRRLGRYLSPLPYPSPGSPLIDQGIYAWIRHPLYSGLILSGLGLSLWQGSLRQLLLTLALFLALDRKASLEERFLSDTFPEYPCYRERTAKLVPFLY
jgi:protein-S-isoprenylcysteine O-methyltransferase Ste14